MGFNLIINFHSMIMCTAEVVPTAQTPPISPDGVQAGARYFSYNLYPLVGFDEIHKKFSP